MESKQPEVQSSDMDERRRHPRKQCSYDHVIEVTDLISDRALGRLVNISREGFLLVGTAPIEIDRVLQLALSTAAPDGDRKITVGAVCMWNSEASHPGYYWSGFHMIDVPEESADFFVELLAPDGADRDPTPARPPDSAG